ncbi:MAG: hypothetical protein ACRDT0_11270 [Pseudonocardiaceae bacterium]
MSPYYMIRPWEGALFRSCRRAWELGARERQDYEPVEPSRVFDLDEAIHDALDVYYFPGMWEWDRAIVRPLALQAFGKSMRRQHAAYARHREPSAAQQREWEEHLELGTGMLERYFAFALQADGFTPVQVATQFDVTIPDPASPDNGLTTPDGRGIIHRTRIDMVVMDEHELYWLVEHGTLDRPWDGVDRLLLDEPSLTRSWAWQLGFLTKIEGTIHNELRSDVPGAAGPADRIELDARDGPSGFITQQRNDHFRRTRIPRSGDDLERRGVAIALEAQDMVDPMLRLYPNPSWERCSRCAYRRPCVAMTQGVDERAILDASYRKRTAEEFELGRLGSVWGFVPEVHRVAEHRAPGNRASG